MGGGIIGLIILIVLFNVVARVLKVLTSSKPRSGGQGVERPAPSRPAAPPRTVEQQILEELLELQREREQSLEQDREYRGAETPGTVTPAHEQTVTSRGKPGDPAVWSEEVFNKRETAVPYESQPWRESVHPTASAAPLSPASSAGEPGEPVRRHTWMGPVPHAGVRDMLVSPSTLRRAMLLSVILGPCRARRRYR